MNDETSSSENSQSSSATPLDVLDNSEIASSDTPLDESNSITLLESALSNTTTSETTTIPTYDSWMEKPLNDYTVTEGLLLCVVAALLVIAVLKLFKL